MQVATHKKWNEKHPTISIIPTALYVGWKNGPYSSQSKNGMYVVPYSDHSSYSELMEMISALAPHQIYPIVKHWSKAGWWSDLSSPDQTIKADMTVYRHLLSLPPPDPIIIPESVIQLMCKDALKVLHIQPRKYVLRKGLSPRSSKIQGGMQSSPRSHSLHSFSRGSVATPTSSVTLGSRSGYKERFAATPVSSPTLGSRSAYKGRSTATPTSPLTLGSTSRNVYKERSTASTPTSSITLGSTSKSVYLERNTAGTPTSTATLGSSRSVCKKRNSKQHEKRIQPVRRKLSLPSEESIASREMEVKLIKKTKLDRIISDRRDALMKETADFAECKIKQLNAQTTSGNIEDELQVMAQDSKLILESISYLDFLL